MAPTLSASLCAAPMQCPTKRALRNGPASAKLWFAAEPRNGSVEVGGKHSDSIKPPTLHGVNENTVPPPVAPPKTVVP